MKNILLSFLVIAALSSCSSSPVSNSENKIIKSETTKQDVKSKGFQFDKTNSYSKNKPNKNITKEKKSTSHKGCSAACCSDK